MVEWSPLPQLPLWCLPTQLRPGPPSGRGAGAPSCRARRSRCIADAQDARAGARLAYRAQEAVNPASVMKLVTTFAALDLLGPAFTWNTPVYVDGVVQGGSLKGNVTSRARVTPLVLERLWLLLRRLQAQGIQVIVGDIVLDRSAFAVPAHDPGQRSTASRCALQRGAGCAAAQLQVGGRPPLCRTLGRCGARAVRPAAGRRAAPAHRAAGRCRADCGDWRGGLRPIWATLSVCSRAAIPPVRRTRLAGGLPTRRGLPRVPWRHVARAGRQAHRTGARRQGACRAAPGVPGHIPALAEVVRDVNKFSNNVMAQHVFPRWPCKKNAVASFEGARGAPAMVARAWVN